MFVLERLWSKARHLAGSSSVRAAIGFGLGGVGFAAANLLLAKHLGAFEFGLISLLLALNEFGLSLGSAGFELIANRHRPAASLKFALTVAATCTLVGIGVSWVAHTVYQVNTLLGGILVLMLLGRTLTKVAAALFQAEQQFSTALFLGQMHNFLLLLAVGVALALDTTTLVFIVSFTATGYLIVAAVGWSLARSRFIAQREVVSGAVMLKEGLGAVGIGMATLILWQAERFAIPKFLSMEAMATYGVLAAVVGAPFRMMQLGVGYTMLPKLRVANSFGEVRRLLASELKVAAAVCFVGTVFVLALTPWVVESFLDGKYDISASLLGAAIVVGYIKIWEGFAVSSLYALGTPSTLSLMTGSGWLALAIAAGGTWLLQDRGLVGIVYGVGLGWLWQALTASVLAIIAMKTRWRTAAPG